MVCISRSLLMSFGQNFCSTYLFIWFLLLCNAKALEMSHTFIQWVSLLGCWNFALVTCWPEQCLHSCRGAVCLTVTVELQHTPSSNTIEDWEGTDTEAGMEDSGPTLASGPTSNSNPPIMEESSAKLFFCRWVRHRIPLAHREEFYHILRMTGPLVRTGTAHLACCVFPKWHHILPI